MDDHVAEIEEGLNKSAQTMLAYIATRIEDRRKKEGALNGEAAEGVPMRYLDEPRYHKQEEVVCANCRTPPSVARFISCCMALRSGFKAARKGVVDFGLAERYWLSACLELMTENVLKVPENDWKTTLTATDGQLIHRFFSEAAEEMIYWLRDLQFAEPDADFYMFGPLAAAIQRVIIDCNVITVDGEQKIAIREDMIVRVAPSGNLIINDLVPSALLAACRKVGAAAEYRVGKCPAQLAVQVESGLIGVELDHTWRTLEANGKIIECWHKLAARYEAYEKTDDIAIRRELFTFTPSENSWFDFYVREYCTPTPYHAKFADPKFIDGKQVVENIAFVEEITEKMCLHVLYDSHSSAKAVEMNKAWKSLAARFAMRCLTHAAPSYSEQRKFCLDLSRFMDLFAEAVATIGGEPETMPPGPEAVPVPEEEVTAPESSPEDLMQKDPRFVALMKQMQMQTELSQKILSKVEGMIESKKGHPKLPPSGAIELLEKVQAAVCASLEGVREKNKVKCCAIFNDAEAKEAIRRLFGETFHLGQEEAADLNRLWYKTRKSIVDYTRFLSVHGVKDADGAVICFESQDIAIMTERLEEDERGTSHLRVEVTKELFCYFVDRPLIKEGDFSTTEKVAFDWAKCLSRLPRFKCDSTCANVLDRVHTGDPDYPRIEPYLSMPDSAQTVIQMLLAAAAQTDEDDWWISSKYDQGQKTFSGAFQASAASARRFYLDQIQVGTNGNHKGQWRILPEAMFRDRYLHNNPKVDPLRGS